MRPRSEPVVPDAAAKPGWRWDSPFVLALAGTLAVHLLVAVAGDAIVLTHPYHVPPPAPHVELVDVELPPIVKPPPPPPVAPPEVDREPPPPVVARVRAEPRRAVAAPPPPIEPPEPPVEPPEPSGSGPVVSLPDLAPGATGVAVAVGPVRGGHRGRGGTGSGTGGGAGSGAADAVPQPVSIATIKTIAMPRGDYDYVQIKDYPAEAKQLGIEGVIRVRLIVDEHGKVEATRLLTGLGHGLDELALHRAAAIEFAPARDTEDRPVSSVVVWTFNMTLPR